MIRKDMFDAFEPETTLLAQHPRLCRADKFFSFQFWAAYVPCEAQYKDAVQITLEQIDVIERLTDRYSPQMTKCSSVYGN